MENKTAVEWLLQNIPDLGKYIPLGVSMELYAKFQQALELEKEQILQTYKIAQVNVMINATVRSEQYYSETYNKPTE